MMTMQGDDLRRLRQLTRLTQGQFAQALGFSQGYIGEMERGEKPVERRTAFAALFLADHLGPIREALGVAYRPIDQPALETFGADLYRRLLASIGDRA